MGFCVLVGIPCLLTGGTEVQTLSLVQALVRAGHRVHVVCYFEFSWEMVRRYVEAGAKIHLLDQWLEAYKSESPRDDDAAALGKSGASSADGAAFGKWVVAQESAAGVHPAAARPQGVAAQARFLWRGLRRVVREVRPDVAHVQYMAPGAIPIVILRALGVRRIFATAHTAGDIYSPRGLKLIRLLNDRLLAGWQCITERAERSFFGESRLWEKGLRMGKHGNHFTIYNCLPGYVSVREEPRRRGETVTVGVVSRLERIKGMDLAARALAQVCAEGGGKVRGLVVGDGSLRGEMERIVREGGAEALVEFAGRQRQDRLEELYDRIDVLLMPSRSEGFGLTAVEGMARGCVPVVSDTGGLPEVVRDGVDGVVHRSEDLGDLVGKLRGLLWDVGLLERLSLGALERAGAFGFEVYAGKIGEVYDSIDT